MEAATRAKPLAETAEFHGKLVAMNEALMLSSTRQHELIEVTESSNAKLQKEIAARRQAEASVRASEKRYRLLFDLGPVAIYSCDASGVIQKFNRSAAKLWGRKPALGDTRERFCGSFKLFRPDGSFVPREKCPMAEVLAGKKLSVRNAEVVIERRDGSRVIAVADIRPLKNKRGEITGAINCFYDITEHKKAEESQRRIAVLAASNRKLELQIVQRRAAEAALKTSERCQRQLLAESQGIRDQLRLLSRQLLLAQEEERKRISRELHDVIAQTLTGINLRLAALKRDAPMNAKGRERHLTRTQQLIEQVVTVVHQFARELRPAVLDDVGLVPALHTYMKDFKKETGLQVSLSAFAALEHVNADTRIVLYRIAQESLTNVARHAQATRVEVNIQKLDGAVCMKIKDNGRGMAAEGARRAGTNQRLGLLGMRERLEMVGGKFNIESVSGKGTTITAEIPLDKFRGGTEDNEPKASP